MNSANLYGGGDVCVCSRMHVRTCIGLRACMKEGRKEIFIWQSIHNIMLFTNSSFSLKDHH